MVGLRVRSRILAACLLPVAVGATGCGRLASASGDASGTSASAHSPRAASGRASSSDRGSAPSAPDPSIGTPLDIALPDAVAALRLTTSDGATVSLASLHGKVVVVSDTMSLCQESCPLDTASLVQAARDENGAGHASDVVYLTITVDPARDDAAQLAAYRALFTPVPANWRTLTGPTSVLSQLWDALGVWRQKVAEDESPPARNWRTGAALSYDINHSDEVFFFDRSGTLRFLLEGVPHTSAGLVPPTLRSFLSDVGKQHLRAPDADAWTSAQAEQVINWLIALP